MFFKVKSENGTGQRNILANANSPKCKKVQCITHKKYTDPLTAAIISGEEFRNAFALAILSTWNALPPLDCAKTSPRQRHPDPIWTIILIILYPFILLHFYLLYLLLAILHICLLLVSIIGKRTLFSEISPKPGHSRHSININ